MKLDPLSVKYLQLYVPGDFCCLNFSVISVTFRYVVSQVSFFISVHVKLCI